MKRLRLLSSIRRQVRTYTNSSLQPSRMSNHLVTNERTTRKQPSRLQFVLRRVMPMERPFTNTRLFHIITSWRMERQHLRSPIMRTFKGNSFRHPTKEVIKRTIKSGQSLPITSLLFRSAIKPSPIVIRRRNKGRLTRHTLMLSMRQVTLITMSKRSAIIRPVITMIYTMYDQMRINSTSMAFLMINVREGAPNVIRLVISMRRQVNDRPKGTNY